MSLKFLLVILTANPIGDLSAAFVGAETKTQCEERGEAIKGILEAGKVEIKEFVCLKSDQQFEKFVHGGPKDAPRYSYSLKLGPDRVEIAAQSSQQTCETALRAEASDDGLRAYCATSTQAMLPSSTNR